MEKEKEKIAKRYRKIKIGSRVFLFAGEELDQFGWFNKRNNENPESIKRGL